MVLPHSAALSPKAMKQLLVLPALALSGCSAFGLGGGLYVAARPPALVLDNETGRTVYYIAIEANAAALVDLNPNVEEWPSLAAGRTLSIPYDLLDGFDEGDTEAVVYWSTGKNWKRERVQL